MKPLGSVLLPHACCHMLVRLRLPRPILCIMTFPLDIRDAWTRAKERYLEDLTPAERLLYSNATPESLLYDASAAEKLHGASSISRGALKRCLETLVGIIGPYGKALDVYTSAAPLVMSPLWGSIRVILHV